MRNPRFVLTAFLAVTSACTTAPNQDPGTAAPPQLAITGVSVVDVEGGRVLPDQTVLIEGNRVTAVGRTTEVRVPRGTRLVDGAGRYLIPGLWDMHTHLSEAHPTMLGLLLAKGVTGVRDMGAASFAVARARRDSIAAGLLLGPRMRIASPVVENPNWLAFAKRMNEQAGIPWTLHERFGPASAEEAIRWVDSVAALGPDHIKVRNWPAPDIGLALVERARARGIPVVGHANQPFPRTGVATYEHQVWPPMSGSEAARDSLWQDFVASGVAFVPTLVTWPIRLESPDTLLAMLESGRTAGLRYVSAGIVRKWRDELLGLKQETPQDWTGFYRAALRDVAEMRRAGIPLLVGTDLGAPLVVPGFSVHDELELLVRDAGLTPLQALRAATLAPARAMGLSESLGTVAPGKLADLVLLDANPLAEITNTRRIRAVVANGRLLDHAALDLLLAAVEETTR